MLTISWNIQALKQRVRASLPGCGEAKRSTWMMQLRKNDLEPIWQNFSRQLTRSCPTLPDFHAIVHMFLSCSTCSECSNLVALKCNLRNPFRNNPKTPRDGGDSNNAHGFFDLFWSYFSSLMIPQLCCSWEGKRIARFTFWTISKIEFSLESINADLLLNPASSIHFRALMAETETRKTQNECSTRLMVCIVSGKRNVKS